jgi:transposase
MDDTIAIDATHIEARDQAPAKEEKAKPDPKNVDLNQKKNKRNGFRFYGECN